MDGKVKSIRTLWVALEGDGSSSSHLPLTAERASLLALFVSDPIGLREEHSTLSFLTMACISPSEWH